MFLKKKKITKSNDNLKLFEKRMRAIKTIADHNMETAQYGKHFPVRDSVVVSWEDLLKIWNIADLALAETPVED
jgi:hypothetical protein